MWYVIQVMGGQEEETACLIRKQVSSELLKECFIPRKERMKKFRGRWQRVEELLFPGYVFVVTDAPEELFAGLKAVPRLTKLLQDGNCTFLALSDAEAKLIRRIGDNYHVTRLSRVQVREPGIKKELPENSRIVILDGPLKNLEGRIVRCNLHKREVTVSVVFMGRNMEMRLGVEMVGEKKE